MFTYLYYCEVVLGKGLLPDIEAKCGRHKWTLQQDGAPAHTARNTMEYLEKTKIDFIEPDMWPQTAGILILSITLSGLPFSSEFITDENSGLEELKQTIVTEWKNLSQSFIDSCINEWRRRLECVVKNGGGHIEHCNFVE